MKTGSTRDVETSFAKLTRRVTPEGFDSAAGEVVAIHIRIVLTGVGFVQTFDVWKKRVSVAFTLVTHIHGPGSQDSSSSSDRILQFVKLGVYYTSHTQTWTSSGRSTRFQRRGSNFYRCHWVINAVRYQ